MNEELICLCGSKCPEEIVKLRQQLEKAEARAAELEASLAELIHHYSETWGLPILERAEAARDGAGYPWLLRKQAEAVSRVGDQEPYAILNGKAVWTVATIDELADELRQQADEAEKENTHA